MSVAFAVAVAVVAMAEAEAEADTVSWQLPVSLFASCLLPLAACNMPVGKGRQKFVRRNWLVS